MADQEADFSFQEPQPNDEYFHPIWDKKKDFILRYSENHRGGVKGWPFLNGIEKKNSANNTRYLHGYGDYRVPEHTTNALDGHFEMAFNRLFLGPLGCKTLPGSWRSCFRNARVERSQEEENRGYFFKDAWEGREGDAGGFEFEMLVQLLDDPIRRDAKSIIFSTGNSQAPRSTENAQYMVEDTLPNLYQRLVILCQETLLGPATYLERKQILDPTSERGRSYSDSLHRVLPRKLCPVHAPRPLRTFRNLTNFQRYLLRLGLNFVKTPSNEGTMYASPKNIAFMLSKHIPKKKDGTFGKPRDGRSLLWAQFR